MTHPARKLPRHYAIGAVLHPLLGREKRKIVSGLMTRSQMNAANHNVLQDLNVGMLPHKGWSVTYSDILRTHY